MAWPDREMTVLVTGGAGYIGSHVVLALLETGRPVVVVDDLSTGFRSAVPPEVPFYQGRVDDRALIGRLFQTRAIDSVVHLAGRISVPGSLDDPLGYYQNNVAAALMLAQTCIEAGVNRFIFSSSAAVYGAGASAPIPEDFPKQPSSPYGRSKLMTENMLVDLATAHPAFTPISLRYFNVGGADPAGRAGQRNANGTGLIGLALDAALGVRAHLDICGDDYDTRDGTGERDYIHVSDLARAHGAALDYLVGGGRQAAMNLGYGRGATVLEVVSALETVLGRGIACRRTPRRPGDCARAISDVSQLRATLDWRPRQDTLALILESALAWRLGRENRWETISMPAPHG